MSPQDDLIYDVGMHNGDDADYYLRKGYRVVGIEANPAFCDLCTARFADEIAQGRMTVLNVGVGPEPGRFTFHINEGETQVSTFSEPAFEASWKTIEMAVVRLSDIMREHGVPAFAKIDVEHYDHLVLQELLSKGIKPHYVSAEAHTFETLETLLDMGYQHFRLVPGETVPQLYGTHRIRRRDGEELGYGFQPFSSGPFGDDLPAPWMTAAEIRTALAKVGLGWVDIHARA